jgi:hypothetical protein
MGETNVVFICAKYYGGSRVSSLVGLHRSDESVGDGVVGHVVGDRFGKAAAELFLEPEDDTAKGRANYLRKGDEEVRTVDKVKHPKKEAGKDDGHYCGNLLRRRVFAKRCGYEMDDVLCRRLDDPPEDDFLYDGRKDAYGERGGKLAVVKRRFIGYGVVLVFSNEEGNAFDG